VLISSAKTKFFFSPCVTSQDKCGGLRPKGHTGTAKATRTYSKLKKEKKIKKKEKRGKE